MGTGTVREIRGERYLIDPDPSSFKGSDYWELARTSPRRLRPGSDGFFWAPRDFGLRISNIDTEPRPWWRDL